MTIRDQLYTAADKVLTKVDSYLNATHSVQAMYEDTKGGYEYQMENHFSYGGGRRKVLDQMRAMIIDLKSRLMNVREDDKLFSNLVIWQLGFRVLQFQMDQIEIRSINGRKIDARARLIAAEQAVAPKEAQAKAARTALEKLWEIVPSISEVSAVVTVTTANVAKKAAEKTVKEINHELSEAKEKLKIAEKELKSAEKELSQQSKGWSKWTPQYHALLKKEARLDDARAAKVAAEEVIGVLAIAAARAQEAVNAAKTVVNAAQAEAKATVRKMTQVESPDMVAKGNIKAANDIALKQAQEVTIAIKIVAATKVAIAAEDEVRAAKNAVTKAKAALAVGRSDDYYAIAENLINSTKDLFAFISGAKRENANIAEKAALEAKIANLEKVSKVLLEQELDSPISREEEYAILINQPYRARASTPLMMPGNPCYQNGNSASPRSVSASVDSDVRPDSSARSTM